MKQTEIAVGNIAETDLEEPLTYPVEAFLSAEYLSAEKELLWPRTWQMVERIEDIPNVGDWFTYNICDDSIIVIRVASGDGPGALKAFHNVCPHRGRQLVDVLPGQHDARGSNRKNFIFGFHGPTYVTDGNNTFILDPQDWKGALNPECTSLSPVRVDVWGGWIFVCMDPDAPSLLEFMGEVDRILGPYQFEKMRYKWRNWVVFDCNWKTALEAFMEPYHVAGTHTQLLEYGEYYAYSKSYSLHGVSGFDERDTEKRGIGGSSSTMRAGKGEDARISTYELTRENWETVNNASTTWTLVEAARLLQEELPEGTPTAQVIGHWFRRAKEMDAERGVIWPELTPEQIDKQRQAQKDVIAKSDVVITTAQVFGRKPPVLVTSDMVAGMSPGSVIVDMAADTGGNVEGSVPDQIVTVGGVTIIGKGNLAGEVARHASQMYSSNLFNLVEDNWNQELKQFVVDFKGDILPGCIITHGGEVVNETIKKIIEGGA